MRCPVCRLDRALYGEVDAGSDWTEFFKLTIVRLGWSQDDATGGEQFCTKPNRQRAGRKLLGTYVDDGAASGPKDELEEDIAEIGSEVVLKRPGPLEQFLGVHFFVAETEGHYRHIFDQVLYAKRLVELFVAELGED